MTELEFINQNIHDASDADLKILAQDCNYLSQHGVWNVSGHMYQLLTEYAENNNGEFPAAMPIVINVALEFMKRNADKTT